LVTDSKKEQRKSQTLNRSRAREMRRKPVSTEDLFWSYVRNRKLGGHKFKRQFLIEPFIADFVCVEKMLVVELDGALHADRKEYDADRDRFFESQGYEVMRFSNEAFAGDVSTILKTIELALGTPSPRPPPRSAGARENMA
jgi:very-short-patch-repair endonuclease